MVKATTRQGEEHISRKNTSTASIYEKLDAENYKQETSTAAHSLEGKFGRNLVSQEGFINLNDEDDNTGSVEKTDFFQKKAKSEPRRDDCPTETASKISSIKGISGNKDVCFGERRNEDRDASPGDSVGNRTVVSSMEANAVRARKSAKETTTDITCVLGTSNEAFPKSRSSLKTRSIVSDDAQILKGSSDNSSCASGVSESLSKTQASLRSKSASVAANETKSSVKVKIAKSKEEAVKAKFQQPLISLKTGGLFGKRN